MSAQTKPELRHFPRDDAVPPAQAYATLLDEGTYLASQSTMYRLPAASDEVRERRDQLRRPKSTKPELLATKSNE